MPLDPELAVYLTQITDLPYREAIHQPVLRIRWGDFELTAPVTVHVDLS